MGEGRLPRLRLSMALRHLRLGEVSSGIWAVPSLRIQLPRRPSSWPVFAPSVGWAVEATRRKGAVGEAPGLRERRDHAGVSDPPGNGRPPPRGCGGPASPHLPPRPWPRGAVLRRPLLADALPTTVSGLSRGPSTVWEIANVTRKGL